MIILERLHEQAAPQPTESLSIQIVKDYMGAMRLHEQILLHPLNAANQTAVEIAQSHEQDCFEKYQTLILDTTENLLIQQQFTQAFNRIEQLRYQSLAASERLAQLQESDDKKLINLAQQRMQRAQKAFADSTPLRTTILDQLKKAAVEIYIDLNKAQLNHGGVEKPAWWPALYFSDSLEENMRVARYWAVLAGATKEEFRPLD